MSLGVERSVNFTMSDWKDPGLSSHTPYRNFSHISVVTFGLSSISKNLRSKRTSVGLPGGERKLFFSPDSRDRRNDFRLAQILCQNLHGGWG